jgi:hypothetical protein
MVIDCALQSFSKCVIVILYYVLQGSALVVLDWRLEKMNIFVLHRFKFIKCRLNNELIVNPMMMCVMQLKRQFSYVCIYLFISIYAFYFLCYTTILQYGSMVLLAEVYE